MRETLDCFTIEYSGRGPSGVCMLTARPLKQGMAVVCYGDAIVPRIKEFCFRMTFQCRLSFAGVHKRFSDTD